MVLKLETGLMSRALLFGDLDCKGLEQSNLEIRLSISQQLYLMQDQYLISEGAGHFHSALQANHKGTFSFLMNTAT